MTMDDLNREEALVETMTISVLCDLWNSGVRINLSAVEATPLASFDPSIFIVR